MKQTAPLIFDIETNGLDPDKVHCLVTRQYGITKTFTGNEILNGIDTLKDNLVVGHNVIKYDLPVLKKLYGYEHSEELVHDTLVLSRLIYPDIKQLDVKLLHKGRIKPHLVNRHNLESWGCRLDMLKGDFGKANASWSSFSKEMLEYCIQDVKITEKLYAYLTNKDFSKQSIALEHRVAQILFEQEKKGLGFDEKKAIELHGKLLKRTNKIKENLSVKFGSWEEDLGEFIPKVNNKKLGYIKGQPIRKKKTVVFNPSSRQHIANRFYKFYNWKPEKFTEHGQPIVDEDVLKGLNYPEAKELYEYLSIEKRLGFISDGNNAWLKVNKFGRIHTHYVTNIITGRMSSRSPNLQQVPSINTPYGKECRELFVPSKGYVLVGADASGLEARCLAHYIYNYTGGKEYVDLILNGDIHTYNMNIMGITNRGHAKNAFYAILYGCSYKKLSEMLKIDVRDGKKLLDRFYLGLPFLKEIRQDINEKLEAVGHIKAIDGRKLQIRSAHSSLNSLIQSCGAIIMKKALTLLWETIKTHDAFVVANIHDEFQIETREMLAETVGKIAITSIEEAGKHFQLRVPITGEYKVGKNWAETH